MEKQKPWQLALIIAVLIITLYNILPTIIYYTKPLKSPIGPNRALVIEQDIATRVDALEQDAREWLSSYCNLIRVTPTHITSSKEDPSLITVEFKDKKEADTFRKMMPQAGAEIPFPPAQLTVSFDNANEARVVVLRRLGITLDAKNLKKVFHFSEKTTSDNKITPFYFDLVQSRFAAIVTHLHGSEVWKLPLQDMKREQGAPQDDLQRIASEIVTVHATFAGTPIEKRYFKSLFEYDQRVAIANRLIARLEAEKKTIEASAGKDATSAADYIKEKIDLFSKALSVLHKEMPLIEQGVQGLSKADVEKILGDEYKKDSSKSAVYRLLLGDRSPFFAEATIDWMNDSIALRLHKDVAELLSQERSTEEIALTQDLVRKEILSAIAVVNAATDENITADGQAFVVALNHLPSSKSFLALDLENVGKEYVNDMASFLRLHFHPKHADLKSLKVLTSTEYDKAPLEEKRLSIVVCMPTEEVPVISGLRRGSVYVILRGMQSIIDQYTTAPDSADAKLFSQEFEKLARMFQQRGFIGYSGASYGMSHELYGDFIFELDDYYSMLIKATREDFYVLGSKRYAILEFSDVEQRIVAQNRIDDAIQEDLLRWNESYGAAQVDLNPMMRYMVPKPTRNSFFANFKLAAKKYFRGDDRKILRWGLDLSGGKSVRIALFDTAGHRVEKMDDLRQASNELYTRINKMGVSERTIRIENSTILLDFPGSQGLSASELVKASAMYFHVVNEQFAIGQKAPFAREVNEFLKDVWNEAVVTNRQDSDGINEIAYEKLQAASKRPGTHSAAAMLYSKGLRLASPKGKQSTVAFDDSVSMIARLRLDDRKLWDTREHPLIIVFKNFALEGSSLENVSTGYDPTKGNVLYFNVKGSYARGSGNPRDDFYAWTSQFAEEGIAGTPRETATQGNGWRMAVILNGSVISAPSLHAGLRDHAMISGNFSQRDVTKLASDLKAGSLSFSPKILSENNVSPELGELERTKGIGASLIGVLLVLVTMISYYRFAGIVASIAVTINMFIIWAVLQNIDAALTLPGLAGIVLTVSMAVDANVLVFERYREEFKLSGRIIPAIQAGYRKAFSAIIDSNLTVIIAAVILLQFDCGPIRGFAMTLIIGVISSMFTALFMTRFFFAGWVQNPEHKELKMAEWIKAPHFDFLSMVKPVVIFSISLFAIGLFVFAFQSKAMVGMDFTGGYALTVELDSAKGGKNHLTEQVVHALRAKGVKPSEMQIRELGRPELLRIQIATSLEQPGRPFNKMPHELEGNNFAYDYQKNPRIVFIVDALKEAHLPIKNSTMSQLANNWTSMSGQLSDTMRNNAIFALLLSLLCVLIYIAVRFEWKFAISAVIALIHDIVLTLAIMAIANWLGLPVQLNLETIGAIMTIIGYSLNDTIIIFDRIREDIRLLRKMSYAEIINYALNQTLSRTMMTSGMTLLVLFALDFFAGSSIFGFAFVMTTGVFLGTLSSLFIAAPLLLWFHNREEQEKQLIAQ